MSVIGGLGSSQNWYQYLQSLNNSPVAPTTAPQAVGPVVSNGEAGGSASTPSTTGTSNTAGATGATSLAQQLETAIQNALNGVSASQNNTPQSVLSTVEQAVQSTLQQNGIDPNQLSQAGGHHGHHGHHHGGGGGGGGSAGGVLAALTSNSTSSTTGGDSSSTGSSTGNSSGASQTPGLDSLLSQLNIDPQQFRNDIISALGGSQNGNLDPSQVFQSFPTGQNVNVLT